MTGNLGQDEAAVLNGSLLRLGAKREIAIYQRGGIAWVADFRGTHAELYTAGEWFTLIGRGSLLRRAGLASIAPLPADVIERIERLHAAEDRASLAAMATRLLDRLARVCHEFSSRATAGALSPRTQRS